LADLRVGLTGEQNTAVRNAAEQLNTKLVEIEDSMIRLKVTGRGQDGVRWTPKLIDKLGYLADEVDSSDYQPTTQQVAVHDELKERAATYRQRLKNVVEQDVAAFNTMLRQRNVTNVLTGAP